MLNEFSRLELLIGKDGISKIQGTRIAVFGLGGVGGSAVDALARSGVSSLTIVDNDVVSITNINRQLIANHKSIGKKKTDVMEEHLLSINPNIKVGKLDLFYLPETSDQIDLSKFDYVLDCIDTVSAKIDLICRCKKLNVPIISALGCGNRLDPSKLQVTDIAKTHTDPLAKVLRYELRQRGISHTRVVFSTEEPIKINPELIEEKTEKRSIPGSSCFVPPVAGIMMAKEVIKDLLEKE